jgi:tetratricopeptide (TPR) repeat protein
MKTRWWLIARTGGLRRFLRRNDLVSVVASSASVFSSGWIMPRFCFTSRLIVSLLICAGSVCFAEPAPATTRTKDANWLRINSAHFSVLTDAGEPKGRETSTRLEQMRDVFAQLFRKTKLRLPQPLDVVAVRSDEEYIRLAPLHQGRPISAPGFFLAGEDRNFIVLDVAAEDSWRAVSRDFALLLLHFNYPPTQDWFDEGFAQYFSSLRLGDSQAQVGGDPMQNLPWEHQLPGQASAATSSAKTFVELLNHEWLQMPELFTIRAASSDKPASGSHALSTLFYAQSWIVMHYLLSQNKLSDAGGYFGLVEIQKLSIEQAIQQAFGADPAQFGQAVKDYFHALSWAQPTPPNSKTASAAAPANSAYQAIPVLDASQVGSSVVDIKDGQAQALLAEVMVRLPEHRDQGENDLQAVVADPKTDSAIAHRALAWAHLEKKEFDDANEELARAMELDARDPWVHYYLALAKFKVSQSTRKPIQGVSNLIQDLVAVIDWNPDFAEAHNMLAMGRLDGGGVHAATDSMRVAIQLSPRNQQYLLNMVQIDFAGKKWDDATTLLERLKNSPNAEIARAAHKNLADLPTLKKYGVLPQPDSLPGTTATASPKPSAKSSTHTSSGTTAAPADEDSDSDQSSAAPAEPALDKRKVLFLKGKLMTVDCRQSPAATLTVKAGTRTLKLHTDDYKSLLMVGADEFSCEWTDRPIVVNYKAGGKTDGDLVSVEVQ